MRAFVVVVGLLAVLWPVAAVAAPAAAPAQPAAVPAAPVPAPPPVADPARGSGVVDAQPGAAAPGGEPSPALNDEAEPDLVPLDSLPSAVPAEPVAPEPTSKAEADDPAPPVARNKTPVVSDGPVAVTTRLSPDPANIGDVLVYEITAAYPRDVRVNLPTRVSFEPLHHVRTDEGEPESTGEGLRKTFRVELQHFAVGEAEIPGFPLTYVDAEGGINTVQVPARPFVIESLLVNEDDPQRRGEDPPISRTYPDTLTEVIIVSAVATLLVALIAWLVLRRLWGRNKGEALPPPVPAHEVALEALDELEGGELLAHGEVQRYYVELTEIAKGYIEGRFAVEALDRTTEEIRESLRKDPRRVAPLEADQVIAFLEECDLVKFARLQPPETEARDALGSVRGMVQESIPSPDDPQPAEPAADESEASKPAEPAEGADAEASGSTSADAVADDGEASKSGEPEPVVEESEAAEPEAKPAADTTQDAMKQAPSEPASDATAAKQAPADAAPSPSDSDASEDTP
ncbi:MAG: hypothetical protein AAF799_07170 [Myxococcota bacterium]